MISYHIYLHQLTDLRDMHKAHLLCWTILPLKYLTVVKAGLLWWPLPVPMDGLSFVSRFSSLHTAAWYLGGIFPQSKVFWTCSLLELKPFSTELLVLADGWDQWLHQQTTLLPFWGLRGSVVSEYWFYFSDVLILYKSRQLVCNSYLCTTLDHSLIIIFYIFFKILFFREMFSFHVLTHVWGIESSGLSETTYRWCSAIPLCHVANVPSCMSISCCKVA